MHCLYFEMHATDMESTRSCNAKTDMANGARNDKPIEECHLSLTPSLVDVERGSRRSSLLREKHRRSRLSRHGNYHPALHRIDPSHDLDVCPRNKPRKTRNLPAGLPRDRLIRTR